MRPELVAEIKLGIERGVQLRKSSQSVEQSQHNCYHMSTWGLILESPKIFQLPMTHW